MKIVGSYWTPKVNYLVIECWCGNVFDVRADRWRVFCFDCKLEANLANIRKRYRESNG